MLKVFFVMPDLKGGGAQRTVVNIINHLDRKQFNPYLVLFSRTGPYLKNLRADVNIIDLRSYRPRNSLLPLARSLKKHKPEIVFSTLLYTNAVAVFAALAARGRSVSIVRETNNWTAAGRNKRDLPDRLVGWAYRRADKVVCLSQGVAGDCLYRYYLAPERIQVIYNPIDIANIERLASQEPAACPWAADGSGYFEIVAMGRLTRQKGFDLLLQALAAIKTVKWRLTILGEGEERQDLESLAQALGIKERVLMPGFQENPYAWLKRADLFVLSSRWEGFGHVIAEAMACGVPVLATRCDFGPEEIITDGSDGCLCQPDSETDLAEKISFLAEHPEERLRLAANAAKSVVRFQIDTIVKQYEELFLGALSMRDGFLNRKGNTYG